MLEEKSKDQEERITELEKKLASSLQENKELKDELDQATNQLSGGCVLVFEATDELSFCPMSLV